MEYPPLPQPPEPPAQQLPPAPSGDERSPRGRLVVAVLVSIALLGGVALLAAWLLQPAPCHGRAFVSPQFGFCADPPTGWRVVADEKSTAPSDSFFRPAGAATITIRAVAIPTRMGLQDFTKSVLELDTQAGYEANRPASTKIAGVPASTCDISQTSSDLMTREVVLVKDGHAWRITLSDTSNDFARDTAALQHVLDTWEFR